jgi:DnaJ-domain-containing protein 1
MGRLLVLFLIALCIYLAYHGVSDLFQRTFKESRRPDPRDSQPPGRRNNKTGERHYRDVLGISETAGPEEMKAAYRSQLARYHPDKVNHLAAEFQELAASRTKEIVEAYDYFRQKYGFR